MSLVPSCRVRAWLGCGLGLALVACGARTFDPYDEGADAAPPPPDREPRPCAGHEETPDVSPAHANYQKYESTMVIRFSVWYCGPAVLEQSVLARLIRREQDGTEVTLFEGHTQPGLPSGWQEFLGPVTIPYTDGDCIQVEVDPEEEIQQCVDRCNLWDLACP